METTLKKDYTVKEICEGFVYNAQKNASHFF